MPLPIGPFPFILINGTLADANQVMADFNWLLNGINGIGPIGNTANPNKLINPFMEIDQPNEGAPLTIASGTRTIDGFQAGVSATGGAWVGGRTNGIVPGYTYALYLQTGSTAASAVPAAGYGIISSQIEADDLQDTQFGTGNAQSLTLSFWARCSIPGTYYAYLSNNANNRTYVAPFAISTANTSQFFTITFPGDTAGTWQLNGPNLGMTVGWTLASGTNYQGSINTWNSTQILGATGMSNAFLTTANALFTLGPCKLEVGSVATPMLRQSFQSELQRCQRYYEKSFSPGTSTSSAPGAAFCTNTWGGVATTSNSYLLVHYKTTKRAVPTVTTVDGAGAFGSVSYFNGSWLNGGTPSVKSNMNIGTIQMTGQQYYNCDWIADARL